MQDKKDFTADELNRQTLNRLRNEQLKNLFIQAPVALAILRGPEHIVEIANEKILQLWGRTAEEVMEKPVFEMLPDARNQGYEELLNKVFHNGETIVLSESPLNLLRNDRPEQLFLKVVYEPLKEIDGTIAGIMVLADDITEQVNSRKQVEDSELRLKIAIESAHIGTFDWNISLSTFQYSDRLAWMFGYSDISGLLQKDFGDRIHPDDRQIRMESHSVAMKTGTLAYEARIIWPDGSTHWIKVNGRVVYDDRGQPLRMYGTTLNIDDQKMQEEKLQRLINERTLTLQQRNDELISSEERYHKMIDEVQDYAIILLNKDGIIQNWNKGAEKIKQYSENEAVGRHFQIFYLPTDRAEKLPDKLLLEATTKGRALHEGWRLRKDQTRFWGSITLTALHGKDNEVIGFSKVTRDLTERKQAEDKMKAYLLELETQNRELEQFAYVASHDLQEPLRKIQLFIDIIGKNFHNEGVMKNYFGKIISASRRMTELIKSILNYSRLSKDGGQLTDTNLNVVLNQILSDYELLIEEKKATIKTDLLPNIQAIPLQVSQLFANLISNALKFSINAPVITITANTVNKSEIENHPSYLDEGQYLELIFADNGIGFDQKYEKLIFSMFQRLHSKEQFSGTGIGLALCKKVMENHNGFINAKSGNDQGARFLVYFPLKTSSPNSV
jgi:PAS domain S-box-containing protein